MRIKSITIEGMHNVENKIYKFSDLTYLYGSNGAGKSTVMQAIQLALLGYIPGTAKTKTELFRHANDKEMSVTLLLDADGENVVINRTWSGTASSVNSTVTITPNGFDLSAIISELELPIFNFNDFVGMSANKLKDWFIEFLPLADTEISWPTVLRENLVKSGITKVDEDFIYNTVKEIKDFGLSGIDEIRKANEYFKEALSFKKKEAERHQSTIQSLVFYDDLDKSVNEADVRVQIDDYKRKQKVKDEAVARMKQYESAKKQLDAFSDCRYERAEDDPQYAEITHIIEQFEERYKDQVNISNTLSDKVTDYNDTIAIIQEVNITLKANKNTILSIIDSKGICPFTSESCKTIESKMGSYYEELRDYDAKITENESKIETIKSEISKICEESAQLSEAMKKANSNIALAKEDKEKLCYRYEKFNLLKSTIGPEPIIPDEDVDFDALISEQQELLVKIEANKKYNELISSMTNEKFKMEYEISAYNAWIKLTGVNGLQNDESAIKPFMDLADNMNKYISTVFGKDVKTSFNLESKANSFSFGLVRNGKYVPFNLLSSGEKCLYTLALMISLVNTSKSPLKLVMVDDLFDHLDDYNMEKLFAQLQDVKDIQMIFAGVKNSVDDSFVVKVG